jgi:hypothetical protein
MKKILLFILMACLLAGSAAAASVPDDVLYENRNGRQLIVKTYTLQPGADTDSLIEEPFEKEGSSYVFDSIVKQEHPFEHKRLQSETVTVETETDDLAAILEKLEPALAFDDGEYTGALVLDHTSLQTEVTGYSTKYYTVTDTKTIEDLDRNDPGYVPKTTVKNGRTLELSNVEWAVQGTSLSGDTLVPTQYMAVATYSAGASYKAATGYVTTAEYSGEVLSAGIESVTYTVTYYGTPLPVPPPPEPEPVPEPEAFPPVMLIVIGGIVLAVAIAVALYFLLMYKNIKVYDMSEDNVEYELLGKLRISARKPGIDLCSLKKYPELEAVIVIQNRTARKLFGRLVKIRLRGSIATHIVEQAGKEDYIFNISTDAYIRGEDK